jgi:hypothetical protein
MTACATGELLDETMGPLESTGGLPGQIGSGGESGSGGAIPVGGQSSDECVEGEKLCFGKCTPPFAGVGCGLDNCEKCPGTNPDNGKLACANGACTIVCDTGFELQGEECLEDTTSTGGVGGGGGSGGSKATGGAGGGSGGSKATGGTVSTGGSKATGGTSGGGGTISSGGSKATGGSKASGGSTGGATQCVARSCPDCGVVLGPACCTPQNKCGCPIFYIPGTCG